MAKLTDYVDAILRGGIPAAVDLGAGAANRPNLRTETIAPAGTLQDRDAGVVAANAGAAPQPITNFIDGKTIVIGVVGIAAVTVVLAFAFRMAAAAGK